MYLNRKVQKKEAIVKSVLSNNKDKKVVPNIAYYT